MKYIIGNTYQLEHGKGVYVGFEVFTPGGKSLPTVPKDSSDETHHRKIFRLIPGHTWAFTDKLYAAFNKDISTYDPPIPTKSVAR